MSTRKLAPSVVLAILLSASNGLSQETTERYIPIGQSPGISGQTSYIGSISSVDRQNGTVTVGPTEAPMTVEITDQTQIYLDRSHLRKTNLVGSLDDLRVDRRVEIKFVDPDERTAADWIKVAITEDD